MIANGTLVRVVDKHAHGWQRQACTLEAPAVNIPVGKITIKLNGDGLQPDILDAPLRCWIPSSIVVHAVAAKCAGRESYVKIDRYRLTLTAANRSVTYKILPSTLDVATGWYVAIRCD